MTAANRTMPVLAATLIELFGFAVVVVAAAAVAVVGGAVAMPFTPPVTGPLSVSCHRKSVLARVRAICGSLTLA